MHLVRHNWLWLVAGAAALIYFVHYRLAPGSGPLMLAEKGACAALLALWAAVNARGIDGWMIAAVMAFGALGDVTIEAIGLSAGALAFLAGHVVAVALYLRHWRGNSAIVAAVAVVGALAAWLAFRGIAPDGGLAIYVFGLTMMTGTALASRFPVIVGVGALMFFASDWLIFLRMGPLHGSMLPGMLIWPLYAGGQLLIARGVVTTLRKGAVR